MSDDLSLFFAKKKDKKKKTGVAVKMEDVGHILESKARKQEEYDHQEAEDDRRLDEDFSGRRLNNGEESEWIEYGDNNQGRLEGLKIKDMGAETEATEEEEHEDENQKEAQETAKTWGQVEFKSTTEDTSVADMASRAPAAPKAYVPPSQRHGMGGGFRGHGPALDMTNEELFPSLAAASEIEKNKKENEAKTGGGWGTVRSGGGVSENKPTPVSISSGNRGWGAPQPMSVSSSGPPVQPTSSAKERENAVAAMRALAAQSPNTPMAAHAPAPPAEVKKPGPGAYVPPHLRNRN